MIDLGNDYQQQDRNDYGGHAHALHGCEFDLKTGTCLADPGRRVATYDVTVEDDDIMVALKE